MSWKTVSLTKIIDTKIIPTMHLNESSSIDVYLKNLSFPKSKFRKILVENFTIIAHEINKLQLQIREDPHIKTKKPIINKINF